VILAALAEVFDDATRRAAMAVMRAALTSPPTALKGLEFFARLNGELAPTGVPELIDPAAPTAGPQKGSRAG
jgi:hypothetical protein